MAGPGRQDAQLGDGTGFLQRISFRPGRVRHARDYGIFRAVVTTRLLEGCSPTDCPVTGANASGSARRRRSKGENAPGAGAFGVDGHEPATDFTRVHDHVDEVIARIPPNDSQERFESLGVRVIRARASFTGPKEVRAGDSTIRARRFVVATGSKPATPPIPGLDGVAFHQ